jgi:hypothetical protein
MQIGMFCLYPKPTRMSNLHPSLSFSYTFVSRLFLRLASILFALFTTTESEGCECDVLNVDKVRYILKHLLHDSTPFALSSTDRAPGIPKNPILSKQTSAPSSADNIHKAVAPSKQRPTTQLWTTTPASHIIARVPKKVWSSRLFRRHISRISRVYSFTARQRISMYTTIAFFSRYNNSVQMVRGKYQKLERYISQHLLPFSIPLHQHGKKNNKREYLNERLNIKAIYPELHITMQPLFPRHPTPQPSTHPYKPANSIPKALNPKTTEPRAKL